MICFPQMNDIDRAKAQASITTACMHPETLKELKQDEGDASKTVDTFRGLKVIINELMPLDKIALCNKYGQVIAVLKIGRKGKPE